MTPNDFEFIAHLLKTKSGFSLQPSQIYLLESRLNPLLRQNNLIGLEDLINALKLRDTDLQKSVIEAVSINNTRFFRNKEVFDTLLAFLEEKKREKIKLLSAGCAGGQEAVSLELMLWENFPDEQDWDVFAIDMSSDILNKAKKGIYSHYEVQKGLPVRLLLKYFTPIAQNPEVDLGYKNWKLNNDILADIHYSNHNLIEPFQEADFDAVLCRNMISFMVPEAVQKTLENLAKIIKKDGLLIIGISETLPDNPYFKPYKPKLGCYRLARSRSKS